VKYWKFLNYVNQGGKNVIEHWLQTLPTLARIQINTRIQYLEITKHLGRPYTATLKGPCKGLIELRVKVKNILYRPIACHGPNDGEITILAGAIEKGGKFEPLGVCKTALERKLHIFEEGRTDEHSFKEP